MFQQGLEVRARADDPQSRRFPIVAEMRAEGVTDYIALPLSFIGRRGARVELGRTKQPGGFTDEQLAALRQITAPLARVIEIISLRRTASSLLDTYVGNRAGERILGGQIRRGHTEIDECRDLAVRSARLHARCRTACRPRPSSTSSISISTARSPRSAPMAARS